MQAPIKWGLILGAAIAIQTFVFAVAGWHTAYNMAWVWLAIAIGLNVAAVVLCLRETASDRTWAGQLQAGLTLGVVASVLVFLSTWVVTGFMFPDYYLEMADGYRETLMGMDMSQDEVDQSVAAIAGTSAVRSGVEGVVGTMVVSFVAAAVAGVWIRRKD